VTNGETYTYRVTAVNAIGESSPSNEAYATPTATPPPAKTLRVVVTTTSPFVPYGGVYPRGSLVGIAVTVTDSSAGTRLAGASVAVTVYYPNGSISAIGSGRTDVGGTARFTYVTRTSFPTGTYTVVAVASFTGYPSETAQTTFRLT
jgi:hypothetical protein